MKNTPKSDQQPPIHRRQLLAAATSLSIANTLPHLRADEPTNRKRIYIAADDHTDYMWTGNEEAYRQAFLETLDHYLDLADQTDDRAADYQCRWNCDGLLWLREYELNRSPTQLKRLLDRIKSGHISIPMNLLVSCYGGTPTEAVLRGMYYGGMVERKYDLRLTIAVAMENQTLPLGLGMLWSGSGVKYSWKGICGCASKIEHSASQREHDVYWWVGPDDSRILMKWYSLEQPLQKGVYWNEGPGGYAEARHPKLAIQFVDVHPDFNRRNPHSAIGLFGQGWDDLKTIVPLDDAERSFPAVAQQMSNSTRRVIVSNELDYFADIEAHYGKDLPEQSVALGNEWDLYSASMAELSASVKRATEKLRSAEAMATLVRQRDLDFGSDLQELREQAWLAFGTYWEHDWTANGPVSRDERATWQRKIAGQITGYVDELHARAKQALAEQIRCSEDESCYFAFNPLGWNRTDHCEIEWEGEESVVVVDAKSGKATPAQVVTRDQQRTLRFMAKVPSCGYRLFKIVPASEAKLETAAEPSISFEDRVLKSQRQQLRIRDNGSITGWESSSCEKPLIQEQQRANHLEKSLGKVTLESTGPVSTTIRIDVARPTARTTRVTMFEHLDRIEIENRIQENFDEVKSWKYEFNLNDPSTMHEEVGAIIRAATESEGGDYADRNARTDWLTMNHFVTLQDESDAITVSNTDCLFFHLGDDITQQMDSNSSVMHALAGGQVDGRDLGIQRQGGDRQFLQRFALLASAADQTDSTVAMKAALEHQNPLVVGKVTSTGQGTMKRRAMSQLQVKSKHVVCWALKPAESGSNGAGQGTIIRLWNLSNQPSKYTLSMPLGIKACVRTSHVETDLEPMEIDEGKVSETLPSGGMRTLRVHH